MKQTRRHESGRSMVEMVGVLAVMGLITAGAFVLLRSGMASQRRNRVQDEVANIVSTIRTLSAGSDTFANLASDGATDAKGKALLANLRVATTTPFGGSTYYTIRYSSSSSSRFTVKLMGIEAADCNALKSSAWSDAVSGTATCLTTNGTAACAADASNCDFSIQYGQ